MKAFLMIPLLLLLCYNSICQMLNQDADGKSSIVVGGSSLNINIKETLVKANYYYVPKARKGFAWGFDLQGKNAEGVAAMFESGDFSPGAELSGIFGYKIAFPSPSLDLLFYGRASIASSQFKFDKGNTYTTTKSRFVDTTHVGSKFELGLSSRIGGHFLWGIVYGTSQENNQSALTKSVYKYTLNDPTLPGLQQTKDITAYSGTYGKYTNNFLYSDLMYFHMLDTVHYLCPAIYLRRNVSDNESLNESNTVLGVSLNFVTIESGKFLGGVYLQDSDVSNEQDKSIGKRIQFGLIVRFTFDTIGL
jgi:hypothetical protein